jgi:hypothetical protein
VAASDPAERLDRLEARQVLDRHGLAAVPGREVDGLARRRAEPPQVGLRDVADIEPGQRDPGQLGQPHPQPIPPVRLEPGDQPQLVERPEQPRDGAPIEPHPPSDLVHAQDRLGRREGPQHREGVPHRLVRPGRRPPLRHVLPARQQRWQLARA